MRMKKLLVRLIFFFSTIFLICILYVRYSGGIIKRVKGPTTEEQINFSFDKSVERNYDMLILGNSRLYRGINSDKISTFNSFNFSHDNDAFNQCYYKMKYLQNKSKTYDYLVMGVDYFEFSIMSNTRNEYYKPYFDKEYMVDYNLDEEEDKGFEFSEVEEDANRYMTMTFSNTFVPFLKGLYSFIDPSGMENTSFMRDNGQYVNMGEALGDDMTKRKHNILPVQEKYFNTIIDFCDENEIKLFLVMMPVRGQELGNYPDSVITEMDLLFEDKSNQINGYYLNYSKDSRFEKEDFLDITHLNSFGADKFSVILNDDINNRNRIKR